LPLPDQLHPDVNGAVIQESLSSLNIFSDTVFTRLADLRQGMMSEATGFSSGDFLKGFGIWGQGFGNHTDQLKAILTVTTLVPPP